MATITRRSGATMAPSTLVTLGLILLIPVLLTAGPIAASAMIAHHAGVGWSGGLVLAAIAVVVVGSILAAVWSFRLAWQRGHRPFGSRPR
ncbi:hypothetical protein AB0I35_04280 [Nocardia sp. NPDC050378]|uniref:hypothetical protein n=1 Tax=Nocardia sp. NPDC050378 TaxID=3155400 RepID=UPI00340A8401